MNETAKNKGPEDPEGSEPHEFEIPGPDEIVAMEEENVRLKADLAEMQQKYLRTLADYQNSQRRAVGNELEAKLQARTAVVNSVLSVVDHFDLALAQDPGKASAEQIVSGVKVIRDELMHVLQAQGVRIVNPGPGDEFLPACHQAILQQAAEGVEPGRIVATLQVGYTIASPTGERVIRPAKVSVAPQQAVPSTMPTYDYKCNACGHTFELFQSMSENPKRKCPKCGKSALERLIGTGAAIMFKGSGFYQTDYRSDSYRKSAEADKPAIPAADTAKDKPAGDKPSESKPASEPAKAAPEAKPAADPKPGKARRSTSKRK